MLKLFFYALLSLMVLTLAAGQAGLLAGKRPDTLGVQDGRLSPPSQTRNSISSQAALYPEHPQKAYAAIDPLPLRNGDASMSMRLLADTLRQMPGLTVLEQTPDYLRAEAKTRWLGFVDDLEFWHNPQTGVIELRSASRLGREDFGANRTRMEAIRAAYLAQP